MAARTCCIFVQVSRENSEDNGDSAALGEVEAKLLAAKSRILELEEQLRMQPVSRDVQAVPTWETSVVDGPSRNGRIIELEVQV